MALVLVIGRLCDPSSEVHLAEHSFAAGALGGLLDVPVDKVNDDRLYRALDKCVRSSGGYTFAVKSLEHCPDGRDRITKHMLALSTHLGHSKVADTYWYLEATPELMTGIADSCEAFFAGGRP